MEQAFSIPHIWVPRWLRKEETGREFSGLVGSGGLAGKSHALVNAPVIRVASAPAITGPTAFWRLDEASGTRNDSVGAEHLTDNNTVTQATGKVGNAAQFTRANSEFLSRSDSATLSTGDIDFTVFFWCYFDSKPDWMGLVAKSGSGVSLEYAVLYDPNVQQFSWCLKDFAIEHHASTYGTPPLSTWIFVLAWHDSVNNQVGIQINNGTADTAAYAGGITDTAHGFNIGTQDTRYFNGRIDAAGIYKGLYSTDEKTELYNAGAGREYYSGAWH